MNNGTLEIINNFDKVKDIKSKLLYGNILDDADITICIPVYGLSKYFEQTLSSVLNQDENDFKIQIIISDNKEYGDSPNPFIEYLADKNIGNIAYYCSEKTLGQLNNFNRLIELSRTKYVVFIHDDDVLAKDYFYNLTKMRSLLAEKDTAMIHGNFKFFSDIVPEDDKNKIIKVYKITNFRISYVGTSCTGIPSCGYLVNCDIMKEVGGYNDEFESSGDAFPSAIMMNKRYKVYNFGYNTGFYRVAINTSLRLDICQGFIKQDYMFYEDWNRSGGAFRKSYMNFFRNYVYSKNIDGKVHGFGALNKEITVTNLDFRHRYKEYHKFGLINLLHKGFSYVLGFSKTFNTIKF